MSYFFSYLLIPPTFLTIILQIILCSILFHLWTQNKHFLSFSFLHLCRSFSTTSSLKLPIVWTNSDFIGVTTIKSSNTMVVILRTNKLDWSYLDVGAYSLCVMQPHILKIILMKCLVMRHYQNDNLSFYLLTNECESLYLNYTGTWPRL